MFDKHRWAVGVVREAGIPIQSPQGKAITDLLVVSAKRAQRLAKSSGPRGALDDLDFVCMAARALAGHRRPHHEIQASMVVFFQTLMAKQSTPIPTTIEAMPSAGSTA